MAKLDILFEDNHLLIVNKKASDIVHSDKTGDLSLEEIIKSFIKKRDQKPGNVYLAVVHRLDRPTSGALIFAKSSKAASRLSKMFKEKKLTKIYWAICKNQMTTEKGSLTHYLKKNQKNNKSTVFPRETAGAKKAVLHYQHLHTLDHYFLYQVELETGRHHQIRAQFAYSKCPIKGDIKYGARRTNDNASIHLHARSLRFTHPVSNEEINITAPTPTKDALWQSVENLSF